MVVMLAEPRSRKLTNFLLGMPSIHLDPVGKVGTTTNWNCLPAAITADCCWLRNMNVNICVATLICIHREQYWNGGRSDVITPRIMDGGILCLAERIMDLHRAAERIAD